VRKVSEIRFLRVRIGPNEIKIEKEKVLDWPIFKSVKKG